MNNRIDDVTDLVGTDGRIIRPRADFEFMKPRLSRWIALGLGSGLVGFAPGTFGTLFAWVSFTPLHYLLGEIGMGVLILLSLIAGGWAVDRAGRDLGASDHGAIVWDEIVAFWLVLLFIPAGFAAQLGAFLAFRFFDIVKPPPIQQVDARFHNGFGVMADDLVAAGYTLLLFAIWGRLA